MFGNPALDSVKRNAVSRLFEPVHYCLVAALCCISTGCVNTDPIEMVPSSIPLADAYVSDGFRPSNPLDWWLSFHDEHLNRLVSKGLEFNPDANAASSRLQQAVESQQIARSFRWPQINLLGTHQATSARGFDTDNRDNSAAIGFAWDAGLWGARRLERAQASYFINQRWFEEQATRLSISVTIAETYFRIIELRAQEKLLRAQLVNSLEFENLIQVRFRLGQARASDVYQQRAQTKTIEQLIAENTASTTSLETALDILQGQVPGRKNTVGLSSFPTLDRNLSIGEPEDLIRFRPDIRVAYAGVRRAAINVGLTVIDRLPNLSVNVSLQSVASNVSSQDLIQRSVSLLSPIFSGGRLTAATSVASAQLEEARQIYVKTWLEALQEIADLRSQYASQEEVLKAVEERRMFSQKALEAARTRFVLGDQNYLDVLTALREFQDAERAMIGAQGQLVVLRVRLLEAIGQRMCANEKPCTARWKEST